MSTTRPLHSEKPEAQQERGRSELAFASYDLASCVALAKTLHEQGGGFARDDQLAALLGYKSTKNGAFLARLSAARQFQLIAREGSGFKITPLAERILMPISVAQAQEALVEAFLAVPLFKAVYERYKGQELPQGLGLQNALRLQFNVAPKRIPVALRALMDSADTAGFFRTKGSRTQLIIPGAPPSPPTKPGDEIKEKGGGNGGSLPPQPPKSPEDLRNEYVGTLIELLREKGRNGDIDQELMDRIEKLLSLNSRIG